MKKLYMISLGCDKNRVDAEKYLAELLRKHPECSVTEDPQDAEMIIVNTCAFIGPAKEESINTIIDMGEYRKSGALRKLVVTGCLAERYAPQIRKELPEVDEIVPASSYLSRLDSTLSRVPEAEAYSRYLKIAEGCDKRCSYCIIPKLRGRYRSIAMEQLVAEAEGLAGEGARELVLVAQESTMYGLDLYGKKELPRLLRRLSEIQGIEWIRVLYTYPEEIDESLLREIRDNGKLCHYLDMPVQHASDRILAAMNRRTRLDELRRIIFRIREMIPDIALRTTLITGFPGETEEDFETLFRFIEEARFDRLGVFPYSREEGTPAARMKGQIPEKLKLRRRDILMRRQQEIAFAKAESRIGRQLSVMTEGYDSSKGMFFGRSYMDAPDIDCLVYFDSGHGSSLLSGDFVTVIVTGADGYDLVGRRI